jgi:hypothetical protein
MGTMRDVQITPGTPGTPQASAEGGAPGVNAPTIAPTPVGGPTADTSALSANTTLQQVIKYVDSLTPGSQDWNQLINFIQTKSKGAQGKLQSQNIKGPLPGEKPTGDLITPVTVGQPGATVNF